MSFSHLLKWIFVGWLLGFNFVSYAQEGAPLSADLRAKPNKCVALNQGRECFTMVIIDWRLEELSNVCVSIQYTKGEMETLACWDSQASGRLEYEFQSAHNAQLLLVRQPDNQTLASTLIQVSWLYQINSRKRRWRLF